MPSWRPGRRRKSLVETVEDTDCELVAPPKDALRTLAQPLLSSLDKISPRLRPTAVTQQHVRMGMEGPGRRQQTQTGLHTGLLLKQGQIGISNRSASDRSHIHISEADEKIVKRSLFTKHTVAILFIAVSFISVWALALTTHEPEQIALCAGATLAIVLLSLFHIYEQVMELVIHYVQNSLTGSMLPVINSMLSETAGLGFIGVVVQILALKGEDTWLGALSEKLYEKPELPWVRLESSPMRQL